MLNSETRLLNLFSIMSEELNHVPKETTAEARNFAVTRQHERARKRARFGGRRLSIEAASNFEAINTNVGSICVTLDRYVEYNAKLFITEAFERYNRRRDPELIQIDYDYRLINEFWRFGPGSSNGVKGTHTAEKLCQPMTCTAPARPLVQRLRAANVYLHAYDIGNGNDGTTLVDGSRLTTVPKNEETERTIAIEPSGNMAIQLALGQYITEVLRSVGTDIRDQQPLNKLLAHRGSIDGSIATIDMKSASDMFSIDLVRRLLPKGLFDTMLRVRSPVTNLPDGRMITLNMMSTMGNGFTFPMMTLIFLALIYAVRLKRGGPSKFIDYTSTAVFGDDIIIPVDEVPDLVSVLEGCGFVINSDKSYVSGPFRESCGGDYYKGVDVTPFYITTLATSSDVYVALNKVIEWCARHKTLLHQTLLFLRSCIDGEVLFVPEWLGDDSGFRTTMVAARYKYLKPQMKQLRTKCPQFDMMLAVGGYVLPRGPDLVYTPRPFKTRYVVRRSRLPKGYSDGRCPLSRDDHTSQYVESYAFVMCS